MQIKRLKIQNFVGVPAADIEFQKPVSLFVGRNNQGKSTIRDAIEFALMGKARAMSKFNEARNLVHGDNGMLVELDSIDKETGEIRSIRRTVSTSGGTEANSVLRYCLNPQEFIRLPAKERGKLLAGVLGGGMQDVIRDAIAEHIGNIDENLLNEIKRSGVDILDVDALKKQVVECRRQYKRDRQELPEKPPLLADYELENGYDVEADRKKVAELGERISKGGEYLASVRQNLQIKAELMDIEKAIEAEQAKIEKVPELRGHAKPDEVRIMSVCGEVINWILNNKEQANCLCPVCNRPNKRIIFKDRKEDIEEWLSDYQDGIAEQERIAGNNECARSEIGRLQKCRKELNQKLVKIEYKEGSEDLLKHLTEERDKLQVNIANYRRYEDAIRQYEQAEEKAKRLDELIAECDRIDDALKDGGPVKSAIAKGGRKLPINKNLLRLWDIAKLTWSDNGEIALGNIPIEYASASEQYRSGCVMALALAEVSGVGIAALDGFEILVSDNANAFMQAVEDCRINNVLVFYSTDKDFTDVEMPDWLEIFFVNGGKVTKYL